MRTGCLYRLRLLSSHWHSWSLLLYSAVPRPTRYDLRQLVRASAGLCYQRAKGRSISSVEVHRLCEIRRCASPPAVRASGNGIWYNAAPLPSGVGESRRLDVVATPISHPPIDGRRQANLSLLKGRRHRTEEQTGLGEPPAACRFRQLHRRFRPCFYLHHE